MRILLVEDVGHLANTIAEQLRGRGHCVDIASTVSRAKGYIQRGPAYDCLIVDFNMPSTGLSPEQAAQTFNGLFTGWIWLRDEVLMKNRDLASHTIVYSAYLKEFDEYMPGAEVYGVALVSKGEAPAGQRFPAQDQLMSEVSRIESL